MLINSQNLRGMYVGFNTLFNKAFAEAAAQYERIATVTPSTTDSETYAWLGDIPGMKEWVGERSIQNLAASDYTIKNKDFEVTVAVPRNAIEDDKIGLYGPSMEMLGQSAAQHPDDLVFGLLKDGFKEKCFDGKAFFSDSHEVGKSKQSNYSEKALTPASYAEARAAIMGRTNSKGKPLNLVPDLLVVPPALEGMARKILMSDQIDGTTNIYKGTAEILVVPQLSGEDTAWYLMVTKRPLKPLIFQQRRKPKFVSKTAESDDNVFFGKTYLYGADSRCNAGFGLWQMAFGSTGKTPAPSV